MRRKYPIFIKLQRRQDSPVVCSSFKLSEPVDFHYLAN
jgi:hypothetical protein